MASKTELQLVKKLSQKKYRILEEKFIVEGKRLVKEGLDSNCNVIKIYITDEFIDREESFRNYLKKFEPKIDVINKKDFLKISTTKNPQGIAALFEIPNSTEIDFRKNIIIYLENISDPGNLGTILRSCNWFGIQTVLLSKDCADVYNPKVLRASMGAIFHLNIYDDLDTSRIIPKLKIEKFKTLFADMKGLDYRKVDYSERLCLVFCNEAFGPSNELIDLCDDSITIPKFGNIDSLNVSAAAAIILSKTVS